MTPALSPQLVVPRLTVHDIQGVIDTEQFHRFADTNVTVCALTLKNGFVAIGYSACAAAATFDEATGRRLAFENARDRIWELEGYLLRERMTGGVR